jgi:hypothetical protein
MTNRRSGSIVDLLLCVTSVACVVPNKAKIERKACRHSRIATRPAAHHPASDAMLGLAAELHLLKLTQKMREAIVLPERRVALDNRGVPLGECRGQLRLQRIDVGRGLIRGGAHACKRIRFARACGEKSAASHKLHDAASGAAMSRA